MRQLRTIVEKMLIGIVGVSFFAFFNKIFANPSTTHYIILLVVLLSLYFLFAPLLFHAFILVKKSWKVICPKIGILNGYIYTSQRERRCQPLSINIGAETWHYALHNTLKGMSFKRIRSISISELNDSFSLIINPFGENYPEQDTELHTTFHNIRHFIRKGGIFFCTGTPFFWHQNPITGKDAEWSLVKTVNHFQASTDSLSFTKLGISTTMPVNPPEPIQIEVYQKERDIEIAGRIVDEKQKIRRFRAVLTETGGTIPLIREIGDKTYPLCAISYESGYLLQAGVWIENEDDVEFRLIIEALANLTKKRFRPLTYRFFYFR